MVVVVDEWSECCGSDTSGVVVGMGDDDDDDGDPFLLNMMVQLVVLDAAWWR